MIETISLYESNGSPCPYLPDRVWKTQFFSTRACPENFYEVLLNHGFRRSGEHFYRNNCPGCKECLQMRVPVSRFSPSRSQLRSVKKNADITITAAPAEFRKDIYALYYRYCSFKHEKEDADQKSFRRFLCYSPLDTRMMLYHIGEKLAAVGWLDILPRGLSSVYFAFEPDFARRSLGIFSVVKEIELAETMGLDFYYLGFVVENSPKMKYKTAFKPQQRLLDGIWIDH
jgi:arginine-tRNA-protein transferase